MYGSMATVMVPGVIVPRLPPLPVLPPEFVEAAVLAHAATGRHAASTRASHQGLPRLTMTCSFLRRSPRSSHGRSLLDARAALPVHRRAEGRVSQRGAEVLLEVGDVLAGQGACLLGVAFDDRVDQAGVLVDH